jgi:poly(hydroxyalkanoate) depolymerase family esterase
MEHRQSSAADLTRLGIEKRVAGLTGSVRRAVLLVLLALIFTPDSASAATLAEVPEFGTNPGHLQMLVYVPAPLPEHSAVVVVAHGCLQTAADVAEHSGWIELALEHRFALIFPQTSRANEPWGGCFRTWEPDHQQRGAGEPLSVIEMIGWMQSRYRIDRRRTFVTGMSSGGMLTNVLLATYPDVFAAGAPQSATPYKCAMSFAEVAPCASGAKRLSRRELGELARSGYPGYHGRRPRISIWHGSADGLLAVTNLNDELHQWTEIGGIDEMPDRIDFIDGQARYRYDTVPGQLAIETWMVRGLDHAMAVKPSSSRGQCGSVSPYFADAGVCSAYWIAAWFGLVPTRH